MEFREWSRLKLGKPSTYNGVPKNQMRLARVGVQQGKRSYPAGKGKLVAKGVRSGLSGKRVIPGTTALCLINVCTP